jgi:DNA-binding HxlR family transcriptional regulator
MPRQKKTVLCPLGVVGVSGKWKFWIWYRLLDGTKRFGQLQRLLPQASRQMLTIQLRELEQVGVLHREVYEQQPPKVEYSLTDPAHCVEPALRQMYAWGKRSSAQIGMEYDEWLVRLGGRWTFWIWYLLLGGPKRFGDLQRLLPHASRQMLTLHLHELEQMSVLYRRAPAPGSPKAEYTLTDLGKRSEPMLRQLVAWGRWYCEQLGIAYDWPVNEEAEERARPTQAQSMWLDRRPQAPSGQAAESA